MKASQINRKHTDKRGEWKVRGEGRWKIYYKINDGSMDVKITKTSRWSSK